MSKKKWIIYGILNLVTALLSVSIALIIELTINTVSGKRMENFNRIIVYCDCIHYFLLFV